jgi:FkbM family methyltransferase
MLPPAIRQRVWGRFYRPTAPRFLSLFEAAPLRFAPGLRLGMKVVPGDVISDAIAFTGVYDLRLTRWLSTIAQEEGGIFVDVGANLGYFSLLWAAQRDGNRAVAFEASPRNVELLSHNVRQNGLSERVTVHQQAVGARRGRMRFDSGPLDQTGWGGFVRDASEGSIDVEVVPLDEALFDVPQITVLMIDIQGADFWALQGAERVLRERRARHVTWEENKPRMQRLGTSPGEPRRFMERLGYKVVPLSNSAAGVQHWYAAANINNSSAPA